MKMQVLGGMALVAAVSTAAVGQTLPVQSYPYVSGPVTITSCSVNENKSNSTVTPNSLRINYYANKADRKLTSITFRVRYAQTPVTITDTGDFEYKKAITHQFNQLGGLPWTGPMPTVCRVLTATFADGQVENPPYEGPDAEASPMTPGTKSAPVAPGAPAAPVAPAAPAASGGAAAMPAMSAGPAVPDAPVVPSPAAT